MLAQAGWEVTIVTARADGAAKSETVAGVRVERIGSPPLTRARRWRRALSDLSLHPALLWRALRLPRAEVVVTMTDPALLLALGPILKWCKSSTLLHWAQDVQFESAEEMGALRRLSIWSLRQSDRTVAVGQCVKARLVDCGISPESIDVIPNWGPGGADPFTEARERLSEMVDGVSLDRAVDAFEMTLDHMLVEAGRRTKLSAIQFTTSGSVPSDAQKAA